MWEDIVIHAVIAIVLGLSAEPKRAAQLLPVLSKLRDGLNTVYPAAGQ